MHDDLGLLTYATTVIYTCDKGYELSDGTKEQKSFCLQSNEWSSLGQVCTIVTCPSFSVADGAVNFTSLEYGGSAAVICNTGYWANNNRKQMTVYCNDNKNWSQLPTCKVDNLRVSQRQFTITSNTVRESSAVSSEVHARSVLDCAAMCTKNYYCEAVNFKSDGVWEDGGTCRLFLDHSQVDALSSDPDWNYYEVTP